MSAEAALVRLFRVGKRTVTMTIQPPKLGACTNLVCDWKPTVPSRLTKKELRQYRDGRNAVMAELLKGLGGGQGRYDPSNRSNRPSNRSNRLPTYGNWPLEVLTTTRFNKWQRRTVLRALPTLFPTLPTGCVPTPPYPPSHFGRACAPLGGVAPTHGSWL
jgi:hypothetical protein